MVNNKYLIEDSYIVEAVDEISAQQQLDRIPRDFKDPAYADRFKVKRVIKRLPDPTTPVQEKQPDATGEQPTDWLVPKVYHQGEPSESERDPDAEP